MTPHAHNFIRLDTLSRRYRCADCGVIGYRQGHRQHVSPMTCSYKIDRSIRCGGEAVRADGERNHARCVEHVA